MSQEGIYDIIDKASMHIGKVKKSRKIDEITNRKTDVKYFTQLMIKHTSETNSQLGSTMVNVVPEQ